MLLSAYKARERDRIIPTEKANFLISTDGSVPRFFSPNRITHTPRPSHERSKSLLIIRTSLLGFEDAAVLVMGSTDTDEGLADALDEPRSVIEALLSSSTKSRVTELTSVRQQLGRSGKLLNHNVSTFGI